MRSRHRVVTIVMALALAGMTAFSGLVQGKDQATFGVTVLGGGGLTAWLEGSAIRPFVASADGRDPMDGTLVVTVIDERGLATGWNVLVGAGPLPGIDGIASMALVPGPMSVVQGNPDLRGHNVFAVEPVTAWATRLWSSAPAFGDGEYDLVLDGRMGAGSGDHTATIIITISGVSP
jgi:hypothetical protein